MSTPRWVAVYVTYGEAALSAASHSIATLREQHPDVPILGFGDRPLEGTCYGGDPAPVGLGNIAASRYTKTSLMECVGAEWDTWVYLDADTRIRQGVGPALQILADGWEMVMTPSASQGTGWLWNVSEEEREYTVGMLGARPLALQAGVIFVRRTTRTVALWAQWHREWALYGGQDQAALLRALRRCPVRLWLLGRAWNGGAVIEHRFGEARGS